MKLTCPKNPEHKQFYVTAHISETWVVDTESNFLEAMDSDGEVVHEPDSGDLYTCTECGAEALKEN